MSFLNIPKLTLNSIKENAKICFVADYPSHADQQSYQGYSDSAGSTLAQCLGHAGLSMSEASLIFVIPVACSQAESLRYWTPKGGFTTLATAHFDEFKQAVEEANANVYVPLGEIALQAMSTKKGITKWRGSILSSIDFYNNVKIIPTIDPRVAIRQYLYRYFISADLKRIKAESNSKELNLPKRNLIVQPSFLEAKAFLQSCLSAPQVAVDIEVYKMEVSCISFAPSPTLCMSVPFDSRWTIEEERELWLLVASILENESIEKIFQNGMFDISFLFKKNKINTKGYIHDTMVKHNLNYPDFPKGLGFITSLYTREPYYKDEGKTWFNDLKSGTGSIDQFYLYNAKDSAVCIEANDPITIELKKFRNTETYEFNQRLFRPLLYMMARGILVDESALAEHRKEARETRDRLQQKLNELCGFVLNVSSPVQCKKYFYDTLRYAPQTKKSKDPKTGQRKESISTDDKAMKRLIRKYNSEEAKLVTQIRKYRKLIGTYLEVLYDDDKRLRCSFNMAGTATGRLSSSETIFGTGTNMQNLPKSFKKFLIADPGCVIVEVDKAQAEWVATAYVAGDARMIEACENNLDAHVHTANLMFGIPKELIFKEHEVLETSTDEDYILEQRQKHVPEILSYRNLLPNMSCRQAGKKCLVAGTEVLTPQGWVAIEYLDRGAKVAQWNTDGKITFVQPLEYFEFDNTDNVIELSANHVHQVVTPNHRLYIRQDKGRANLATVITAGELDTSQTHWNLPTSGKFCATTKSAIALTPDEIRLLVAIQADGTIDNYGSVILKFEKSRKIKRLQGILNNLDLRYTNEGGYFFVHNTNSLIKKLVYFLTKQKLFGSYLLENTVETLSAFIAEVVFWDGYAEKNQYFTTVETNATWVQTIAHLTNHRATVIERPPTGYGKKNLYWVKIGKSTGTSLVSLTKRELGYKGSVYCLAVPSTFFLVRSSNKISVTGNSNHSFNYGLSPQGFAIQYDMELRYAKQCYSLYHNAYPGLTLWHQHIRNKLGKDRTLENLFGRKRRFLNRWNDDLFKAAYSYIPQSTVGQLLNYGIVETYYQQDMEGFEFLRKWDLLNQVHDSMVFQYPLNDLEGLAKTIKQIQKNLDPKLYCNGREFVIKTDCKIGLNCKDLFGVDLYAEEETLLAQLRQVIETKLHKPTEATIDLNDIDEDESEETSDDESEV